uniref:Uncharacterized protein n=1 Tax=Ditylenchus dipsaci TaxID=166011 RepID=A0A915DH39_9BILA
MNGHTTTPPNFNPNDPKYRTCCCHCKSFTLGFSIVEIFIICFLLVAVVPDFNTKICSIGPSGSENSSITSNNPNGGVKPPDALTISLLMRNPMLYLQNRDHRLYLDYQLSLRVDSHLFQIQSCL